MPERNTIAAYLEAVQEQIRWKRARPVLTRELERHLEDQRDAFVQEGKAPEEAERLAVEDMGDPVAVGTELDRVHRPRPQWGLLGLTLALAVIGAVLRVAFRDVSVGPNTGLGDALEKALISLGLGTAAMLGMYFLDVSRLVRHARALYIGALVMTAPLLWFLHPTYRFILMAALYPLIYTLWLYSFRGRGWKGVLLSISGGVPLAAACCVIPYSLALFILLFSGLAVTLYAAGRDFFGVGRRKGVAAVLAVPAVLLVWLLVKGLRQSYLPGRFVVLAVTLTLGLQTLFSAALNFGFVLFSAGLPLIVGSFQTVMDMALIGLALSVFRGDSIAREEPGGPLRQRKRLRVRVEYQ